MKFGEILENIKRDYIFISLLLLLALLTLLKPGKVRYYPEYVDWRTIIALFGLLVITTGIRESGYLQRASKQLLKNIGSERSLAISLIITAALLSTILTNDVALFIVLPLTLTLQDILSNDIKNLIIFEVIAVNVGSALTPIGNPQNLFLWHSWGGPVSVFYCYYATACSCIIAVAHLVCFLEF